jgi:hypothetical protein
VMRNRLGRFDSCDPPPNYLVFRYLNISSTVVF